VGEEGRRKGDGRTAAARAVVVATASKRLICLVRSERVKANRIRERQARYRRSVTRQTAVRDRHLVPAIRNGELDQQFSEASKRANPRKSSGQRDWSMGSGFAAPHKLPQATKRGGTSITFVSTMVSKQKSHFQQRQT
jgi:hypothetical protein